VAKTYRWYVARLTAIAVDVTSPRRERRGIGDPSGSRATPDDDGASRTAPQIEPVAGLNGPSRNARTHSPVSVWDSKGWGWGVGVARGASQ